MTRRDYDRQNTEITRQTERLHQVGERDQREIHRQLVAAGKQEAILLREAAELDPTAIRHLHNIGYTWAEMAERTNRTIAELQTHEAPPFGRR